MLNIKKITALNTQVIVTANRYDEDQKIGTIISAKKTSGTLKEYQTVVAVGPMVRNIKVGDLVMVNPTRFAKYKHQEGSLKDGVITDNPVIQYNFPIIEIDHKQHLFLQDRDIDYIIDEYEEEEEEEVKPSNIILPKKTIIV